MSKECRSVQIPQLVKCAQDCSWESGSEEQFCEKLLIIRNKNRDIYCIFLRNPLCWIVCDAGTGRLLWNSRMTKLESFSRGWMKRETDTIVWISKRNKAMMTTNLLSIVSTGAVWGSYENFTEKRGLTSYRKASPNLQLLYRERKMSLWFR